MVETRGGSRRTTRAKSLGASASKPMVGLEEESSAAAATTTTTSRRRTTRARSATPNAKAKKQTPSKNQKADEDSKHASDHSKSAGKASTARTRKTTTARSSRELLRRMARDDAEVSRAKRKGNNDDDDDDETENALNWIQCDKCKKWRVVFDIPEEKDVDEVVPEEWFCSMNSADPDNNSCSASEKDQSWYEKRLSKTKEEEDSEKEDDANNHEKGSVHDQSIEYKGDSKDNDDDTKLAAQESDEHRKGSESDDENSCQKGGLAGAVDSNKTVPGSHGSDEKPVTLEQNGDQVVEPPQNASKVEQEISKEMDTKEESMSIGVMKEEEVVESKEADAKLDTTLDETASNSALISATKDVLKTEEFQNVDARTNNKEDSEHDSPADTDEARDLEMEPEESKQVSDEQAVQNGAEEDTTKNQCAIDHDDIESDTDSENEQEDSKDSSDKKAQQHVEQDVNIDDSENETGDESDDEKAVNKDNRKEETNEKDSKDQDILDVSPKAKVFVKSKNSKGFRKSKKPKKQQNALTKLIPGYTAPLSLTTSLSAHRDKESGTSGDAIESLRRKAMREETTAKRASESARVMSQRSETGNFASSYLDSHAGLHKKPKKRLASANATAGPGWFNMQATPMTEEIERDLTLIRNRNYLDPKRFYKSTDLPRSGDKRRVIQVGTVIEGPTEFYSSRLTKKQRKSNLVDEIMADKETSKWSQEKYKKMQQERSSASRKWGKNIPNRKEYRKKKVL